MGKNLDTDTVKTGNVVKSDEEWRKTLTPEEFRVTRQHGTERAFSHPYAQEKRDGMYRCVCCGTPLFSSDTKYDSGTGWPSFYAPAGGEAVSEHEIDRSSRAGPRYAAPNARLILDMSFRMVPTPPVCAIASTASP